MRKLLKQQIIIMAGIYPEPCEYRSKLYFTALILIILWVEETLYMRMLGLEMLNFFSRRLPTY